MVLHGSSGSLAHLKLENLKSQSVLGTDSAGNVVAGSVSGYSLPTATSLVLGGIKVGGTLAISSGILNARTYIGASEAGLGDLEGGGGTSAGTAGYVPAASASQYLSFLRGDGTWQTPTNTVTRLRQSAGTLAAGDFTFAGSGATTVSYSGGTFTISSTDTDTNTTYTAGTGLTLTGTTFSVTANTFAAAAHSHAIRDITGLQTALDGKQVAGSYAASSHTHDDLYLKLTETSSFFDRIIDSAPGTLDTLNELAAAIGDDANFSASLARVIAGKADSSHTHAISAVTGLQTALDGKQASLGFTPYNATNPSGYITSYVDTVTSVGISGDLSTGNVELVGRGATSITKSGGTITITSTDTDTNTTYSAGTGLTLTGTTFSVTSGTYAAASHTHSIGNVTGLQTALDGKQASGDYSVSGHTHSIRDVTDLQTSLDGKAASSHTHAISNVTGLQTALDGKQASGDYAAASHTHGIGSITDAARWWNNFGDNHSTRTSFDLSAPSYGFGWRYVQGSVNGPGTGGSQFYSLYVGLGNEYPSTGAGSYGMYLAIDRNQTNPYLSVRFNENNGLSSWRKINAGYADSAGAVAWTNVSSRPTAVSSFTNDSGYITSYVDTVTSVGISGDLSTGNVEFRGGGATTISKSGGTITITSTDTDTNTTYTAGTGLTLTGTTFSVTSGTYAAASHTHSIGNVTGLQTALDGKQASGDYSVSGHTHSIRDITDLQTSLDGKQASLGFTPYNATNPSGFITGYTETDTLGTVTNRGNSTSQNIVFSNGRKGLVGVYDATQTQAIFAMGAAYVLTDGGASSTIGDFYGLGWSYNPGYGGAGNNPQSISGLNHQLLLMQAGRTTAALGSGIWTSGNISANNFSGTSSGTNTGDQTNISGNAATATNVAYSGLTGTVPTWNQDTTGTAANSNYVNSTRDTPSNALQYWQAPGLGLDEAPSGDWHNTIRMGHGSPLSYYSNTLAVRMTGTGVGDIYTQTIMNGVRQGWKKHWNDSNLTNLNQLTNGPGYITSYVDTVTSVGISGDLSTGNIELVGRGATTISKSGGTITITSTDTDTNTTYTAGTGLTLSGTTFSVTSGTYAAASHTHSIGNVTGLQTALDGKQASGDYSVSGHTHSIRDITDLQTTLDGKLSTSGTAANATTATFVASPDGDRVAGNKLPTSNPRSVRFDFATAGSITGATGNYAGVMTYAPWDGTSASTGDSSYQLAFTNQSGVNASGPAQLVFRNGINSTWNAWLTLLSSANYNNYSPTLTGTGASGTWGISITGNANTATSATSAGSATTAGSAGSVDGLTINNSGAPINPDNVTQNQIGYNTSVSLFGQTDGGLYSSAYSSTWIHQIYGDFRTGQIAIRGKNSGTWGDWRIVVDNRNIGSYAVPYGDMTSSTGLNDNKLYLRTNGDNNHYIWNAADDWEEIVAYSGTGLRIASSTGVTLATFTTSGNSMNINGNATYSLNSTRLYASDAPYTYGGAAPYYMYMTYDGTRWLLQVTPGTPAAVRVNYADSAGTVTHNSGRTDGTWYNAIWGAGNPSPMYSSDAVQIQSSTGALRANIFYDNQDTNYFLNPNSNSYLSTLRVADASSGVSLHVGDGSTHGVYTLDNDRKYLVVSAPYYPHMALVATGANNLNHGAVFSFVGSESGRARQWNLGIPNNDPFVFSIGYNNTGDDNPHYGIGDGWGSSDAHHARLSIDRSGNTKIRGMLYVNGTSGGISTGNAVIHAGNIGSQSVNYATSAGNADTVDGKHATNNASNLAVYESNGYLYIPSWMNVNGGGIFSSTNNAHIRPNTGAYGAWEMIGSKGGWSGIWFNDSSNYLMANSDEVGHYQHNTGWKYRWYRGEMYLSAGSTGGGTERTVLHSGNYSNYALPLSGGTVTGITYFQTNNGGKSGATDSAKLQAYSTGNNAAFMSFHKAGHFAVNFGLDDDNVMRLGGWSASANRMQLDMSGNVTFAGNVTGYSDARIKTDIQTIGNALEKVKQLRGVTFKRTDSDDRSTNMGVIAQEVLAVVPEVVSQDASGMYNVAYGNMAGLLIEAIKQQQTLIEQQQKQIDELKVLVHGLTK